MVITAYCNDYFIPFLSLYFVFNVHQLGRGKSGPDWVARDVLLFFPLFADLLAGSVIQCATPCREAVESVE